MANPTQSIIIIGAGPAGLTAAYELTKRLEDPTSVLVLEADPKYVGGIARTVSHEGFRFDLGGHRFFSKNDEIEALWEEMLGEPLLVRQRLSRIYFGGRFYDYPLKLTNVLRNLGARRSARVLASYVSARVSPREPEKTFEDWVSNRFGRRLFSMFFESYTEKVWGVPCTELSADWAAQRIKGLSLRSAVRDMLPQLPAVDSSEIIKTLIQEFRYPRLGPGMMWEAARDRVLETGGRVEMGQRVVALTRSGDQITEVTTRDREGLERSFAASQVISTAPMSHLITAMADRVPDEVLAAAEALRYRSFLTVVLALDAPDLFPDQWIYIHDGRLRVCRLQNFGNWSPDLVPEPGCSCLGLEYFCDIGDDLWTMDDEGLIELGASELETLGFSQGARIKFGRVVRVPRAYPVYDESYQRHVATIRSWIDDQATNLQLAGRAGMHRYNNQDHSMMTALLAARNLLGEQHDPWLVNTDAEYHEEDRNGSSSSMAGGGTPD